MCKSLSQHRFVQRHKGRRRRGVKNCDTRCRRCNSDSVLLYHSCDVFGSFFCGFVSASVQSARHQSKNRSFSCGLLDLCRACLGLGVSRTVFALLCCHLHVSFPLIFLPVVYWKTYSALRFHNNRVGNLADGREAMDIAHRSRERKMISAFLFVLVLFCVTFLPQFIAQNMLALQPSYLKAESFLFFLFVSNNFVLVNGILNPFIYAWRIPKYRRAFKAVFCGCGSRTRSTNTEAGGRMMAMMIVHRTEPAAMDNKQPTAIST